MALESRGGLELLAADAAGPAMHVRAESFMLGKIVVGFKVLVAFFAVVMFCYALLVVSHGSYGIEGGLAVFVGTCDPFDGL